MNLPHLLVFSDDWGRHPSSCQHLIRALLSETRVTWVNTIGMRPPRLDKITMVRGWEKISGWLSNRRTSGSPGLEAGDDQALPDGLTVIDSKMWPWMARPWDRAINRRLLTSQLAEFAKDATVITTIPIVRDLVGELPASRWVYYCVDDFSVWPGLDGKTLGKMEDELLPKMDAIISASDNLAASIERRGFRSPVVTHGVDLAFWESGPSETGDVLAEFAAPIILFWGVVDRRMNADWLLALADQMETGTVVLLGPIQDPDPRILDHARIQVLGPVPYDSLPGAAARAAVLVMPYADLPVTRAMQPLKFKEYLATGRPVVASPLPAVRPWGDIAHLVESQEAFVETVLAVAADAGADENPVGGSQTLQARLGEESWKAKSKLFMELVLDEV